MDPFTIKPIDAESIIANGKECGGRILVVEDHYPEVSYFTFIIYIINDVINLGSDTFDNPIFQKGLQN